MLLVSHPPQIVTIIPFKGGWDHINVWNPISFVNVYHHKSHHDLVFNEPCVFSFWLGAYNVMPLLWLASTPINQCDAPSNLWSQEKTNISKPHDKTLC
jgi:hypothetical protein